MTSTDPKEREVETGLYAALRNREREIEELKEEIKTLLQVAEDFAHEKNELIRERDKMLDEHATLAAHWRVQTHKRLTQDKYEPPRVAREFARYNWTAHGMMRENPGASHGDWVWCSVADILAFEDERAGMIARIEVLEQQDRKLRADKIVMPRYIALDDPHLTTANTHRGQGYNRAICDWFKLNPSVEVSVAPEGEPK